MKMPFMCACTVCMRGEIDGHVYKQMPDKIH